MISRKGITPSIVLKDKEGVESIQFTTCEHCFYAGEINRGTCFCSHVRVQMVLVAKAKKQCIFYEAKHI